MFNNKYYFKKFKENGNKPVPEARLPPMMVGSVIFAMGLFEFAWTSRYVMSPIFPTPWSTMLIMLQSKHSLANPLHRLHHDRYRLLHHLPSLPQLPGRHLHKVRRFRYRRQHLPALYAGWRVPAIYHAVSACHWSGLGHDNFRVLCCAPGSGALAVLFLR